MNERFANSVVGNPEVVLHGVHVMLAVQEDDLQAYEILLSTVDKVNEGADVEEHLAEGAFGFLWI